MASIAIPLVTLQPGAHSFGPAAISGADHQALLTVDRSAGASSLNAAPAATTLALLAEFSADGGVTWPYRLEALTHGGIYSDSDTGQQNAFTVQGSLPEAVTATHARGTVTVVGTPVSVSGSLVTSA